MQLWTRPAESPVCSLVAIFILWKGLILAIAYWSPGPGYDTSTTLLLHTNTSEQSRALPAILHVLATKLTRWDAIYFFKAANRGYLFEQEWAFGWGFSKFIAWTTAGLENLGISRYEGIEAIVAICIAHLAHLSSVLVLYHLTFVVFPSSTASSAVGVAALHIFAPAGIFLSAPYAESSCALFAFAGILLFSKSFSPQGQNTLIKHDVFLITAGVLFGMSTTLRSNGILNGLLLLEEACRSLFYLMNELSFVRLRRLIASGIGGLCVAFGFLLPQYIAWSDFCTVTDTNGPRPWCRKLLPSIYTFVQDHYWNCGPFRYWTISNLPLFLLASPMLILMTVSSIWGLKHATAESKAQKQKVLEVGAGFPILRNLAVSQMAIVLLTLITAHVQIITRLSSAYPVWLWYAVHASGGARAWLRHIASFAIIYSVIQGGLFATFLPPA